MTPRPKEIMQWANPMTSDHKRDEFTTKKKDGKPKRFEAQIHKKKSLAYLDQGIKESPAERAGPRSPKATKGSGSLGMRSTVEVGLRQLKGSTKKKEHKEQRIDMSFSSTQ